MYTSCVENVTYNGNHWIQLNCSVSSRNWQYPRLINGNVMQKP